MSAKLGAWDEEGNYGTFAPRLCHLHSAGRPCAHILVFNETSRNFVRTTGSTFWESKDRNETFETHMPVAHVLIPSLPGAVAKYCDEHVCMCVCVSARISPEPDSQSLPIFLRMLPMVVARSSFSRVTKSQGEGTVLGVYMHCTAEHF